MKQQLFHSNLKGFIILLYLIIYLPVDTFSQTRLDDSLSLVDFYNITNGPNWTYPWDLNQSIDFWSGVFLLNGRVDCLDLDGDPDCLFFGGLIGKNISGPLIDFNLTALRHLYLRNNLLTGSIPDFSNLPNLEDLSLDNNQLTGVIPEFTNLPLLRSISMTSNQLTGNIPSFSVHTNLEWLSLGDNQLAGNIPDFLNNPLIFFLDLRENQLTGNIPDFPSLSYLWIFDLSSNQLSGSIPDFTAITNIEYLILRSNQLSGTIPDLSSYNLTSLKIDSNHLTFDGMEPLFSLPLSTFDYIPQETILLMHSNDTLYVNAGGTLSNNYYSWYFDNIPIAGIPGDSLFFPYASGSYQCEVTNSQIPGLTLLTEPKSVFVFSLSPKLFLEGALNSTTLLMDDDLRQQQLIPLDDPYTTTESISDTSILSISGPTAIVDWVEIELRSTNDPLLVLNRTVGLLQRDGEVVASDGFSPIDLGLIGVDSAYIAIRHRHHLPALFGPIAAGTTTIDLTTQNGPLLGTGENQKLVNGRWTLYAGDANADLVINAVDRSLVWNSRNQTGYLGVDCDLDGDCDAADRSIIWNNRNVESQLR